VIVFDPLSYYIDFARLMVERDIRLQRETRMAVEKIEIKGLAAGVAAARKGIADARASVAGMQEAGASLKSTVDGVTAALKEAESDIRFEAAQLGNGGPPAETSAPPSPPPASGEASGPDPKVMPFRSS
jgi:hypothetical protein